jgi:methylenetetrahydrofolate reductase (NADPH)
LVEQLTKATKLAEIHEIGVHWCTLQTKDLLAHGAPSVHFYTLGKAESVASVVRSCY